jgi:hypothetical protein
MAEILDLFDWRHRRDTTGTGDEGGDPSTMARLEQAVGRLYPLVERALGAQGRLQPRVETELLAIMGELTVGLVTEAAGRAERLVDRLELPG